MSMHPRPSFDVANLYPRLAPKLRRIVGANLEAPDCVVEDACQIAWTALLDEPPLVDESHVLSWLATTARREALLMLRRSAIELRVIEGGAPTAEADAEDPQRSAEFWERLGQVRRLPRRQQRIVWMRCLGFRYAEIAQETGETLRSVERQLADARSKLAAVG
jgi:RNA polymerase sigma factor (sigma-70 family)